MKKAFYKKIINLIPSDDIKKQVFENGFQFNEKDLLKIILHYAPTFDKKIELFKEAELSFNDKRMRTLAKKRVAFENKQYAVFMQADENAVYEIKIKTDPEAADEDSFITKTFGEAVEMIKNFIKCYEIKAKDLVFARYTVKKKTTNLPKKPYDIFKNKVGTLGTCVLDGKFRIIYLDTYCSDNEAKCIKGVNCDECNRCIDSESPTHFPHFLKPYDLIAYYDDLLYDPEHIRYAILDSDMSKYDCDSTVIEISKNPYIQYRNAFSQDENGYYEVFIAHEHPSYFEIIKPKLEDVPQKILDDYDYAVSAMKKIDGEIAKRN